MTDKDDIERLKDLQRVLEDASTGTGKYFPAPDYCRKQAEVVGRAIERLEDTAEFCDYVLIEPGGEIPERPVSARPSWCYFPVSESIEIGDIVTVNAHGCVEKVNLGQDDFF